MASVELHIPSELIIRAVVEAAGRWMDGEFDQRVQAVERTLQLQNSFTREAIDFAIDQQMAELTFDNLFGWLAGRRSSTSRRVAVLAAGNIPLVDLQDWLAVLLSGHQFVGVPSGKSDKLLAAFADTAGLAEATPMLSLDAALDFADILIATGSAETMSVVRDQALESGLAGASMLLRGSGFGVSVVTGDESTNEWLDLAEDCFLHEGRGCRSVSVVWAPSGVSPDQFIDAGATFRGVFPSHASTPGTLRMPKALLEALGVPCAYTEDLSLLVSRGEPEVCEACHVRWCEYETSADVEKWIHDRRAEIQVVTTNSDEMRQALRPLGIAGNLGTAQRPPIDWKPDGVDTIAFLTSF